jgi:hypothetical protein
MVSFSASLRLPPTGRCPIVLLRSAQKPPYLVLAQRPPHAALVARPIGKSPDFSERALSDQIALQGPGEHCPEAVDDQVGRAVGGTFFSDSIAIADDRDRLEIAGTRRAQRRERTSEPRLDIPTVRWRRPMAEVIQVLTLDLLQ